MENKFSISFGGSRDEKKKKQLIFFDHQNARAIITSTACASCVSLSFSINLLQCSILSRIRRSLIGSATHYPLNN